jgi:hypothetical protein
MRIPSSLFGGGKNVLKNNTLPIAIKLLFENKYLEHIDILSIIYIYKRKRKGIVFEELLYWITLLNAVSFENEKFVLNRLFLQNNYLNYEQKLKLSLRTLINQELVALEINKSNKKNLMYFKLIDAGTSLVNDLKNQYFKQQFEKINYLKEVMPYNSSNERGVLEIK